MEERKIKTTKPKNKQKQNQKKVSEVPDRKWLIESQDFSQIISTTSPKRTLLSQNIRQAIEVLEAPLTND